jgi:hypothetical protein
MFERGRQPGRNFVTVFAHIRCCKVVCGFTLRLGSIVTARAIAGHAGMIELGTRPT